MKKFFDESWLVLAMGVVFAFLLAATQTSLSDRIKHNQEQAFREAIDEVFGGKINPEKVEVDIQAYGRDVFRCLDQDGNHVGWALDAIGNGFAGKIQMVVGLSTGGDRIVGLKVIQNIETPGLGNKIAGDWAEQCDDLDATRPVTVKKGAADKAGNEVQAITGATISSEAVTTIVNDAVERIRPQLEKL